MKPSLERARLLLSSIADIAPDDHPPPLPFDEADPAFQQLFQRYLEELATARKDAEAWFEGLVDGLRAQHRGKSRADAEREVWAEVPCAPTAEPGVIAVIRRCWLATAALNASLPPSRAVPPEQVVLGWLVDDPACHDTALFLSRLSYFPIGIDADGRWV